MISSWIKKNYLNHTAKKKNDVHAWTVSFFYVTPDNFIVTVRQGAPCFCRIGHVILILVCVFVCICRCVHGHPWWRTVVHALEQCQANQPHLETIGWGLSPAATRASAFLILVSQGRASLSLSLSLRLSLSLSVSLSFFCASPFISLLPVQSSRKEI